MHSPYHNPFNQAEATRAQLLGVDVKDLTNIGIYLDSLTTLGTNSSFLDLLRTLGRADEIYTRFANMVKSFHEVIQRT